MKTLLVAFCLAATQLLAADRATNWAVRVEKTGLPNFHKVSDTLYRGAQPDAEGFRQLKALGIKTVVNLRSFHSDRDEMGDVRLRSEHIWFKAWHAEDHEVVRFLKIVTDTNHTPVFVHCQHGADRTGTMCAIYRLAVQGWTKDAAIQEMTEGGYGYHTVWTNLITYLRKLDIEALKKQAGLGSR
jgi:protein tyrosine/serine phosphatase